MTGSWDRLVGWLLYFCPNDPVGSGKKKEMAIYRDGEEITTSFAWRTRKPISSWVRGQAGAEGRRDYELRLGVRRLEG